MDGQVRSHEARRSPALTSQRTPKQRANVASRRVNHAPTFSAAGESITTMRGNSGLASAGGQQGDIGKTRRGSIRHAVRKIFGRSSRDNSAAAAAAAATATATPSSPQVSAPMAGPISRHAYHKSEPVPAYPPQLPEASLPFHENDIIPQTILTSHIRAKTSSPYAVSFPKSVMLKPMDLGNPFTPHSQMKRRKTMPNTGAPLRDATDAAASVPPIPVPTGQIKDYPDLLDDRHARRAMSQIKKNRRKSRSTDDLVASGADVSYPIQRSSEMRQWRESFQPDVLRASGFTTGTIGTATSRQVSTANEGHIPVLLASDTFESARGSLSSRSSPKHSQDFPRGDEVSRPSSPEDLSHDLEQRVLKLEAGLDSFQRSLARLTADRNRRTIVLRSDMTARRSSNDMRTPSMLADTLVDSLEPSTYAYEYGRTVRPSASLSPPPLLQSRQPYDSEPDEPLTPQSDHYADSVRLPTPPHTRSPGHHLPASLPPSTSADSPRERQQYTFHSVYQMLSDERSARQKLERHLNHLQREISDLHAQVNVTTSSQQQRNPQQDRNSYLLVGSSARLQQLLQETEEAANLGGASFKLSSSSSSSSSSSPPLLGEGQRPATKSRFSGSESEEVGLVDNRECSEGETPYGAYLTPREERSAQSLLVGRFVGKDDTDHGDADAGRDKMDCMF